MSDDTLFDPEPYTSRRATSTRHAQPSVDIEPQPWRANWYRIGSKKGPAPYWHRLADAGRMKDGASATLCGIVGRKITHYPDLDGDFMVPCPACMAQPGTRLVRNTDPSTSKAAAAAVTDDQTTTQLTRIERIIHAAGIRGVTDEEICRELAPLGWADSGIRTRRQTLYEMAVIAQRGLRMSSRGRLMRIWLHSDYLTDSIEASMTQ